MPSSIKISNQSAPPRHDNDFSESFQHHVLNIGMEMALVVLPSKYSIVMSLSN